MKGSLKIGGPSKATSILGKVCTKILKRMGLYVYGLSEYQIDASHGLYHIDYSDENEILGIHKSIDILLALTPEIIAKSWENIKDNSIIFTNQEIKISQFKKDIKERKISIFNVPKTKENDLSDKVTVDYLSMLAATLGLIGADNITIKETIMNASENRPLATKSENIKAIDKGYKYIKTKIKKRPKINTIKKNQDALLIDGGKSLAIGALESDCIYFVHSSRDEKESTGIVKFLSNISESVNIKINNAVSPNSAASEALGGNYAGKRALLILEDYQLAEVQKAIDAAAIAEIPLVALINQKSGLAKGLPHSTSQKSFTTAIHSSINNNLIVISPGDIEDCYHDIQTAFNIADKYQVPVLILIENQLISARSIVYTNNFKPKPIDLGKIQKKIERGYQRYKMTKDGITPRVVPGISKDNFHTTFKEHNEIGKDIYSREDYLKIQEKRDTKYETIKSHIEEPELFGPPDANITIVGYGATKGTVIKALDVINKETPTTNFLYYKYLHPFKEEAINKIVSKGNKLVVIENDKTGNFSKYINGQSGVRATKNVRKFDGRPFFIDELT